MSISAEAAQNLSQKSLTLANQTGDWFANNSVDILIASGIGIAIALVLIGIRSLGCKLMGRADGSGDPHWPLIFARVLAKTNIFFIVMASAELVAEHAATPPPFLRIVHIVFVIAAAFQAAVWARELVLGYVEHRVGADEHHGTLGSAVGIIRLLVTVALFAIAIILILDNVGVNVTGLIAGLGIGGIAIGLAAQGIFSDLFAALAIIFDKPFRRGDSIRIEGVQGNVEDIGLKTTRIRSISGEQVVVSNAKLLEQQIHNYALLGHRRFVVPFGLVYQLSPDTLAAVPDMTRAVVEAHDKAGFVRCGITAFGASSLDFELQFDVNTNDFEEAFETRHLICVDIVRRFTEAGIAFAYPTQTSFTAAPDGSFVLPYAEPKADPS
ncbi:MAG TPA: mechanosensitive ion channel domain-containing protein [Allosphingosinicella sp.]|nr:mechanosensitive ion channel domain-containing protein [Allosphingosinicella sp.]